MPQLLYLRMNSRSLDLSRLAVFKLEATRYYLLHVHLFLFLNFVALLILICIIWQQGFCFGFVEFEVASAVQSAMEVCFSFLMQKLFSLSECMSV